jgi:hypothetical protein
MPDYSPPEYVPMQRTSQFPKTGVTIAAVQAVLDFHNGAPVTCKEIGIALGIDTTVERNLKSISNACGYNATKGLAHRVSPGTYQAGPAPQKGKAMTMTDIPGHSGFNPLTAVPPTAAPALVDANEFKCDECGSQCKSQMGLRAHKTRAHSDKLTPDEMFERTGRALEVLFPDGIPFSRIIELAELQKAMLKALK